MDGNGKIVTEFVIVRHGESEANRQGIFQGWYDSPLDDNGRRQAALAAEYLKGRKFDAVYCSDLLRARETLQIILKFHPDSCEPVFTEKLREWHLGVLEGRLQKDLLKEHSALMSAFLREDGDPQAPEGESRSQFQQRVSELFLEAAKAHPGGTILVCTHGGVFQRVFRMAAGVVSPGNLAPLPVNASVSTVRYLNEWNSWQLMSWNIHEHLNGLEIRRTLMY